MSKRSRDDMIDFPCAKCHQPLSVPQELAGDDVQCPHCGLLNSVPIEGEAVHADGTLHVAPIVEKENPDRLAELARMFGTRSIEGEELDNRGEPDIFDLAPPIDSPKPIPLQFDPETGEVVTALEILPPIARPAPPGASSSAPPPPPSLSYATPGKTPNAHLSGLWLRLFEPVNAAVMTFIFIAYCITGFIFPFILLMLGVLEKQGLFHIPAWLFNLVFWLVAAHFAIVVEETGPEERDELPRPLRHLAFIDDIVAPLTRILTAFLLSYWPAIILINTPMNEVVRALAVCCLVLGGIFFPAFLLTLAGGRAIANLRPDRVLRVFTHGGGTYWLVAGLSVVVLPVYLQTLASIDLVSPLVEGTDAWDFYAWVITRWYFTMPLAIGAIYAMHGICWSLGQIFRRHGTQFRWAWEELDAEREEDRKRRRVADQKAAARRRKEADARHASNAVPPKRLVMESLQSREHL